MKDGAANANDEGHQDVRSERDGTARASGNDVQREGPAGAPIRGAGDGVPGGQSIGISAARGEFIARLFGENRPAWFPDWRGQTAIVIGSGPSAASAGLASAEGKCRAIAVNESWKLAPWADALYGCDGSWWRMNKGVPKFTGLKITQDQNATAQFVPIFLIKCVRKMDDMQFDVPGQVGWGGNGGFQAVNLAAQFGASRIVLVGFDMRLDKGSHWHGEHRKGLHNPQHKNVAHWRRALDGAAKPLRNLGITVVNASEISALTAFPKTSLEEALSLQVTGG